MKDVLTLIIDQINFDHIIAGTKKEEYRSFSDYYITRFCVLEKEEIVDVKPIKAIRLAVGYAKNRKWAVVEVDGIFIDTFEKFIPEGFEKGDQCFTLELGTILKSN